MQIESLADLAADLEKRIAESGWRIKGPKEFEWGYVRAANITFWTADRRVHFYFEGVHGRIYVIVECAEVGPPRRAVVGRIQDSDEAFLILSQFLRKGCDFADLPGDEWLSDVPMHDEAIPHPPDAESGEAAPPPRAARPEAKLNLVGTAPQRAAAPAPAEAKIAGVAGIILYSNDARRLARWYCDMLGAELQEQGGQYMGRIGGTQLSIQESETPIASGTRPVLLSYAVSDFESYVQDLATRGADILGLDESKLGKFAYTRDSDGNPIEIWSPPGR